MKGYLILLSLFAASVIAQAAPVLRSDARRTAQDFLANRGIQMQDREPFHAPRKGQAVASKDNAYYYVFNVGNHEGFVIVSGDDRTEQILGYCDHGDFDADSIPEHMRSWLQTYADDIQWLEDHQVEQTQEDVQARHARRRSRKVYHSIPALLKTRWNQSWPYNKNCPHYVNEDGTEGNPPVGCVAVAMAQLMNYYRYPEQTTATLDNISKTYTVKTSSGTTSRTVSTGSVPAGTAIDWEHMRNSYGSYTDEELEAVANLMLYCGLGVRMSWSKSGSGAVFSKMASSLRSQFGYESSVFVASRGNYSIDEWFDLVYDELEAGHPVAFAGNAGGSSGHAFVLDGFDGEGMFHVNWGWGGMSDGWYVLSVLKPGDQTGDGDSSTTGGYSMAQGALIGVRTPGTFVRKADSSLTVSDISCSTTYISATYTNETGFAGSFDTGIVMYNEETNTCELIPRTSQKLSSMRDEESRDIRVNLSARLPEGVYKVSPASKLTTADEWHPQYDFKSRYILVTVNSARIPTLQMKEPVVSLEIDSIMFPTGCVVGNQQEVRMRIHNTGDEFYGKIELYGGYDGEKNSLGSKAAVNIRGGETITMSYYFTPTKVGTMTLYLCSSGGGTTYAQKDVEIISETSAAHLSVTGITFDNALDGTIYTNRLQGSFQVKNLGSHDFSGKIKVQRWIQKSAGSSIYLSSSSNTFEVTVAAGKTTTVPYCVTGLSYGLKYSLVFYYVGQSGTLGNGELFKHTFLMNPGTIYWKDTGTMVPLGESSTISTPTAASAVYCSNIKVTSIRPNRNPNTLYVVSGSSSRPFLMENSNLVFDGVAPDVRFEDGNAFYVPVSFTAENATFSHTFPDTADGTAWETFLLPFAADSITVDGIEYQLNDEATPFCLYEFSRLDRDNMPSFLPAIQLRENTPYIIAASQAMAGKTVVFHGRDVVFRPMSDAGYVLSSQTFNQYGITCQTNLKNVYVLDDSGTAFTFVPNKRLMPLQTYFTTKLSDELRPESIPLPAIPEHIATGLVALPMRLPQPSILYDLQGRRLPAGTTLNSRLAPGLYIVNGRKMLVK